MHPVGGVLRRTVTIVPLSESVVSLVALLQANAGEGQIYVFVNSKGPNEGKRIHRQNTWRDFEAIRVKAGIPECSMHDLRKSYCPNLAEAVPMHVLQELSGHSDIRTTRRYYVKVQPKYMDAARQAVETSLETCKEV